MPYDANSNELEILEFWKKNKMFEKSVEQRPEDKPYVFYDGPPFATGLPHYGHLVPSVLKDAVPRYWTMQGKRVERVWGWDCHGLPIENIVEKELGFKSKKDIEAMGVATFNEACRSKVLGYVDEWKKVIERFGRWVDMDNAYQTMDKNYMESVWWVFKQLYDKGYVYEGYRSMHICPRCETTLSQQEVAEGYKDVKDISVTAKFKIKENGKWKMENGLNVDSDIYFLAWTTTPWTLPGNVALAVGSDIEYVLVKFFRTDQGELLYEPNSTFSRKDCKEEIVILAKKRLNEHVERKGSVSVEETQMNRERGMEYAHEVIKEMSAKDLVDLEYEPLFSYYKDTINAFRVIAADFVSTEEGTGIVHIAPAFGNDDYEVGKREKIGWVQHVSTDGSFKKEVTDFAGLKVKQVNDTTSTDIEIVKWLDHNGKLFSKQKIEHSYPHCWRCDTPLLNYATSSWFVDITKIKPLALETAKEINWVPEHIKEGRFGMWLAGARDWSISRQRFWASVIPIWQSEAGDKICIGSVAELEQLSGQKIDDLHKHIVDFITFEKDGNVYRRIPDVLDTWFDSGSMPYAQIHYPFERREKFEQGFPAEFIAEAQDQTRAWFYYLHMIAAAIDNSVAFKNVIVNGIVLAEDGKKMSKKLKNYPDPMDVITTYGADALRFYLLSSPVVNAENLNFSEAGVREMFNKVVNTWWNVFEFYQMYNEETQKSKFKTQNLHILDRWILARTHQLVKEVTEKMNQYRLVEATRPALDFIADLSQWYVRRSRDRFKGDDEADKQAALVTLRQVLLILAKVMAPFTPFIAEKIYQELRTQQSVHLEEWPVADESLIDTQLLDDMAQARKIVEMGLSARKEAGIKVRQPLEKFSVLSFELSTELSDIVADELNVKQVVFDANVQGDDWLVKEDGKMKVALHTRITAELKQEGLVREIARAINQMRKEQKLTPEQTVRVMYHTDDAELALVLRDFKSEIKRQTRAERVAAGEGGEEIVIDDKRVRLKIEKS